MTATTVDRAAYPYLLPPVGEAPRVLFVGSRSRVSSCLPPPSARRIVPSGVDLRPGFDPRELRTALAAVTPHVVVFLEPHVIPAGILGSTRAVTLAFLAEDPGADSADEPAGIGVLPAQADFDRIVSANRLLAPGGDGDTALLPVWRSFPLPVDDRLYGPVRIASRPPRGLVLAEETRHREWMLIRAKHEHDLLHYAHGLWGDALRDVLNRVDIGINVHRERYQSTFESRALVHLAAGHLLLSEPLTPLHGLEPGIDFVTFEDPDELLSLLFQLRQRPDMHERTRVRGRAKADDHRASRVWPRIVEDLILDVATFGSERRIS